MLLRVYKYLSDFEEKVMVFCQSRVMVAALLILIVNLSLKLWNQSEVSYHLDEATHVYHSQKSIPDIIKFSNQDPNPPFYNIVVGLWSKVCGVSEASTRFLSVLFSSLVAVLLFIFGLRYLNTRAGLYAALIYSVSNIHLYYSHEARVYALVCLLTMLSFILFIEVLRNPKKRNWILLTVINTLLLYTHYVPIFALFAQFIAALVLHKKFRAGFIYYFRSQIIVLVLFAPWVIFNNSPEDKITTWLNPPFLGDIKALLLRYAGDKYLLIALAAIGLVSLITFGIHFLRKKSFGSIKPEMLLILSLWLIVPFLTDIIVSHLVIPIFLERYLLFATLAGYLLLGYLVSSVKFENLIVSGIMAAVVFYGLHMLNLNPKKYEDWKAAMPYVKSWKTTETLIVVNSWYQFPTFSYYYDRPSYECPDSTLKYMAKKGVSFANDSSFFKSIDLNEFPRVILAQGHHLVADPTNSSFRYLDSLYAFRQSLFFDGIKISLFEKSAKQLTDTVKHTYDNIKPKTKYTERIMDLPNAYSGSKVTFASLNSPYGYPMEIPFNQITNHNQVHFEVSGQILTKSLGANPKIVFSADNGLGESYFWYHIDLENFIKKENEWARFSAPISIYNIQSDRDVLKVFLWVDGQEAAYLDDMEIRVVKE